MPCIFIILYHDQQKHNYFTNYHTATCFDTMGSSSHVSRLNCKLYYQQLHLKYLCNLARYWLQSVWGWHESVETCSSVITCGEIIVYLLVIVQNNKLCYQQLRLKYLCNLARYWLQAVWGWYDSAETCSSVITCGEIIVYLLVIVQNNKLYYQQLYLKYLCNLARYWLQAVWGWHDSAETCSSVITCGETIAHLNFELYGL